MLILFFILFLGNTQFEVEPMLSPLSQLYKLLKTPDPGDVS